jgi:hypothetical protein
MSLKCQLIQFHTFILINSALKNIYVFCPTQSYNYSVLTFAMLCCPSILLRKPPIFQIFFFLRSRWKVCDIYMYKYKTDLKSVCYWLAPIWELPGSHIEGQLWCDVVLPSSRRTGIEQSVCRHGRPSCRGSSTGRGKIFLFSSSSTPVLGPIQRIPGALSPGVKRLRREADLSHTTSAEVKNTWIYMSIPQYVFMGQFYLFSYVLLGNVSA